MAHPSGDDAVDQAVGTVVPSGIGGTSSVVESIPVEFTIQNGAEFRMSSVNRIVTAPENPEIFGDAVGSVFKRDRTQPVIELRLKGHSLDAPAADTVEFPHEREICRRIVLPQRLIEGQFPAFHLLDEQMGAAEVAPVAGVAGHGAACRSLLCPQNDDISLPERMRTLTKFHGELTPCPIFCNPVISIPKSLPLKRNETPGRIRRQRGEDGGVNDDLRFCRGGFSIPVFRRPAQFMFSRPDGVRQFFYME